MNTISRCNLAYVRPFYKKVIDLVKMNNFNVNSIKIIKNSALLAKNPEENPKFPNHTFPYIEVGIFTG